MTNQYTVLPFPENFWAKVDMSGDCWLWQGARGKLDGYGRFKWEGESRLAHHISFELANDRPVTPGLWLDHLCREHSCVNNSHLEEVTPQENSIRGDTGLYNKIKTHCPQGHPYSEQNTYMYRGHRGCITCRREAAKRFYIPVN